MELEDALWLGAVCQAFFLQEEAEGLEAVFGSVGRFSEEFRCIEGEVLDAGGELGAGGIGRKVLPFLKG